MAQAKAVRARAEKKPIDLGEAFLAPPKEKPVRDSEGVFAVLARLFAGKLDRRTALVTVLASAADGAVGAAPRAAMDVILARHVQLKKLKPERRDAIEAMYESKPRGASRAGHVRHACQSLPAKLRASAFIGAVAIVLSDDSVPVHRQDMLARLGEQLALDKDKAQGWVGLLRAKYQVFTDPLAQGAFADAFKGLPGALTPLEARFALIVCAALADGKHDNASPEELRALAQLYPQFRTMSSAMFEAMHAKIWDRARNAAAELATDAALSVPEERRMSVYVQALDAAFAFSHEPGRTTHYLSSLAGALGLSQADTDAAVGLVRAQYGYT